MVTTTQRKKGWWKIWAILIVAVALIAIIGVLAMLGILDLAPYEAAYLGVFMWASVASINAFLLTGGLLLGGVFIAYLWYNYLKGQQVKTATAPQAGYAPTPAYPSTPQQNDTETVIS